MTLEEFRKAEGLEGYRYELARGVLEVTEVPNDPHWQIVSNLSGHFHHYKADHPGVILRIGGGGECRVWVPEMASGRNPDLAVVLHGTPKDERGRRPPSLLVEVVTRGGEDRDYQEKRAEYLAFGAREYWIVDPQLRQVVVLVRRNGAGGAAWEDRVFRVQEVIESELLPGLAVAVAGLWADAELEGPGADGPG